MAFVEHSASIYSEDLSLAKEFLRDTIGLVQDENDDTIFWCDETKRVGLQVMYVSGTGIKLRAGYNSDGTLKGWNLDGSIAYNSSATTYWQFSKDKDVKYIRGYVTSATTIMGRLILAKDSNGEWCILSDNYLYHKGGRMTLGGVNTTTAANTPFSAVQMPNLASPTGGKFTGLYKILTATIFSLAGTYVNFEEEPYRVVNTENVNANSATHPNFAFPVADE